MVPKIPNSKIWSLKFEKISVRKYERKLQYQLWIDELAGEGLGINYNTNLSIRSKSLPEYWRRRSLAPPQPSSHRPQPRTPPKGLTYSSIGQTLQQQNLDSNYCPCASSTAKATTHLVTRRLRLRMAKDCRCPPTLQPICESNIMRMKKCWGHA